MPVAKVLKWACAELQRASSLRWSPSYELHESRPGAVMPLVYQRFQAVLQWVLRALAPQSLLMGGTGSKAAQWRQKTMMERSSMDLRWSRSTVYGAGTLTRWCRILRTCCSTSRGGGDRRRAFSGHSAAY